MHIFCLFSARENNTDKMSPRLNRILSETQMQAEVLSYE